MRLREVNDIVYSYLMTFNSSSLTLNITIQYDKTNIMYRPLLPVSWKIILGCEWIGLDCKQTTKISMKSVCGIEKKNVGEWYIYWIKVPKT